MGIKNNKGKKINTVFFIFLVRMIISILLAVLVSTGIYILAVEVGILYRADAVQSEIQKLLQLESITMVEERLADVSPRVHFLELVNGEITVSNMNEEDQEKAMAYLKNNRVRCENDIYWYYDLVSDTKSIVFQYNMNNAYAIEKLNNILPNPDFFWYGMMLGLSVVAIILQFMSIEKYFRNELQPLYDATQMIAQRDLTSEFGTSRIKEFNEVLSAFGEMRYELLTSMEAQWKLQEERKNQIAALAHDLKTPLTISMGNAELLTETELDEEQSTYMTSISEGLDRLEKYTKILSQMAVSNSVYEYDLKEGNIVEFFERISSEAKSLCTAKHITLNIALPKQEIIYRFDSKMLERMMLNIIHNSIEYTPVDGVISIKVEEKEQELEILVEDSGKGFSKNVMEHGTELFYMDDSSRNKANHYGIGLHFSDIVIRKHNGKIKLYNSKETGGAVVMITLPV